MSTIVRTQQELDAALADGKTDIIIDSPRGADDYARDEVEREGFPNMGPAISIFVHRFFVEAQGMKSYDEVAP